MIRAPVSEECNLVGVLRKTGTTEATLILPKRHIASIFEATKEGVAALWAALLQARTQLLKEFSPDGFNIGINDGLAAGQTILHLHIHIIPHYKGDMLDPRGGIRWIFPDEAVYWKA